MCQELKIKVSGAAQLALAFSHDSMNWLKGLDRVHCIRGILWDEVRKLSGGRERGESVARAKSAMKWWKTCVLTLLYHENPWNYYIILYTYILGPPQISWNIVGILAFECASPWQELAETRSHCWKLTEVAATAASKSIGSKRALKAYMVGD